MKNQNKENFIKMKAAIDGNESIGSNFMYEEIGEALYDIEESSDIEDSVKELFQDAALVDQHGGEGQGEDYWSVIKFEKAQVMIEFRGWYASYSGSEYEGCMQVEPRQVEVTKYFEI